MLDGPHNRPVDITVRDMRILQLVVQGFSNKQIAYELHLSPRTIEQLARMLVKKMGASNRAHAAALAVGLGMVQIVEPLRT